MCALKFSLMKMDIFPNKGTIAWKREKTIFLYFCTIFPTQIVLRELAEIMWRTFLIRNKSLKN